MNKTDDIQVAEVVAEEEEEVQNTAQPLSSSSRCGYNCIVSNKKEYTSSDHLNFNIFPEKVMIPFICSLEFISPKAILLQQKSLFRVICALHYYTDHYRYMVFQKTDSHKFGTASGSDASYLLVTIPALIDVSPGKVFIASKIFKCEYSAALKNDLPISKFECCNEITTNFEMVIYLPSSLPRPSITQQNIQIQNELYDENGTRRGSFSKVEEELMRDVTRGSSHRNDAVCVIL